MYIGGKSSASRIAGAKASGSINKNVGGGGKTTLDGSVPYTCDELMRKGNLTVQEENKYNWCSRLDFE